MEDVVKMKIPNPLHPDPESVFVGLSGAQEWYFLLAHGMRPIQVVPKPCVIGAAGVVGVAPTCAQATEKGTDSAGLW